MKRMTALLLSLILVLSLCACGVKPGQTDSGPDFTEPTDVTLPDGSIVYSEAPFVEYPQTGEYKETALLTNIPGQGVPMLLDMRRDGTIDCIFADVESKADFLNFSDSGAMYFAIAPDGTAMEQDSEWMAEIDRYTATCPDITPDPAGKWRYLLAAEEGTLLILAQYHNIVQKPADGAPGMAHNLITSGSFLYSVLFKVDSGQVSVIPLNWEVDDGKRIIDLGTTYLSSLEMESGRIIITKRDGINSEFNLFCTAAFNTDGTVVTVQNLEIEMPLMGGNAYMDDTGLLVYTADQVLETQVPEWSVYYQIGQSAAQWNENIRNEQYAEFYDEWFDPSGFADPADIQYTEDDSLYYLGKGLPNMKAHAQGEGKDFCCWFDEAGKGILLRYTYNPEGKIEPEVVTVWSLEPIDLVKTAVAQWNHTHASPIFRYETAESELAGTHQTEEDVLTRLNLELLNNQGPDVLILDGLNVSNLLEFMTPLDRVNTEGVYGSILSRFTLDGELLAIPARMNPYLLGRLPEGTEDIESLEQFANIVTTATDVIDDIEWLAQRKAPYNMRDYAQLFQLWYPAWADAIWEGNRLHKEVFQEFLTQTLRLSRHYTLQGHGIRHGKTSWLAEYEDYAELARSGDLDFFPYLQEPDGNMRIMREYQFPYTLTANNHMGIYTYWIYNTVIGTNKRPTPHYLDAIPGPDGTGAMVPTVLAGVRAGGNEAAGQEFVQILLSRELQLGGAYHSTTQADGYPVKWQYTEELIQRMEDYMHQDYTVENDYQEVLNNMRTVVIDETLYGMALYAAQCCYRMEPNDFYISNGLTWDVLTPDEAADLLEDLSRIYLAELR